MHDAVRATVGLFHVSKSYAAGHFALRDVCLEFQRGEFALLSGPSGAGKTTLLKLIFAAERASEGQILVLGRNASRLGAAAIPSLRRRIGVVFQDFKLMPRRTVEENVALALEVVGTPRREVRARVFAILKQLGLQDRRFHHPLSLSGGEQQRVAIARATVAKPPLILADEPTGELDSVNARSIFGLFEEMVRSQGISVVAATHDSTLLELADEVVEIRDGKMVDHTEALLRFRS